MRRGFRWSGPRCISSSADISLNVNPKAACSRLLQRCGFFRKKQCRIFAQTAVTSPDGRIAVQFALDASGVPSYRVDVDGKPFLMPSAMGLSSDDAMLDRGFALQSSHVRSHRETWHQPWGENKEVEDNHRELSLTLKNEAGVGLEIVFRVFDDGFGFRYAYAVPGIDTLRINGERTQFAFAADAEDAAVGGGRCQYALHFEVLRRPVRRRP